MTDEKREKIGCENNPKEKREKKKMQNEPEKRHHFNELIRQFAPGNFRLIQLAVNL